MLQLVAQRSHVGDVGGDLTDDVAQPLVQRTVGHAEAENEEKRYDQVERQAWRSVATIGGRRWPRRRPWTLYCQELQKTEGRSRRRPSPGAFVRPEESLTKKMITEV
eukprot:1782041-Pleurochrysis_carterae.AAC.1